MLAAISSASAVESAGTDWRDERHSKIAPPHIKSIPVCDLVELPAKPASDQAVRSVRSPDAGRKMLVSLVPNKYLRIFFANAKDQLLNFVRALDKRLTK